MTLRLFIGTLVAFALTVVGIGAIIRTDCGGPCWTLEPKRPPDPCARFLADAVKQVKTSQQFDEAQRKINPNANVPHVKNRALAVDSVTDYLSCIAPK
jgi:hypothetical protein